MRKSLFKPRQSVSISTHVTKLCGVAFILDCSVEIAKVGRMILMAVLVVIRWCNSVVLWVVLSWMVSILSVLVVRVKVFDVVSAPVIVITAKVRFVHSVMFLVVKSYITVRVPRPIGVMVARPVWVIVRIQVHDGV